MLALGKLIVVKRGWQVIRWLQGCEQRLRVSGEEQTDCPRQLEKGSGR